MNITISKLILKLIPASCPFARSFHFGNHTLVIPPLCKLNPFYNNLMQLRLKAWNTLAELENKKLVEKHGHIYPVVNYPESNIC
jgi:hypothetical protein